MIVVFGSINVDIVVPVPHLPTAGETVLGESYRLVAGGKGANQALAAARAGAGVRLVGRVGRDGFADIALAELRAGGVDLSDVARGDEPTGLAAICVDTAGRNQIAVASGANRAVTERQVADRLLGPDKVLLLQMEVGLEENWRLVERAKARGTRILLNTAPAGPVPAHVLRRLDWLVANEIEVTDCARRMGLAAGDPRAAGKAISDTGVTVVVTLGAEGAVAFGRGEAWRVGVLPIMQVDTTGAGDAFVGVFAAAMDAGADLPTALHRASVAGGLACTVVGAQPSLPTKAAIEARLKDLAPAERLTA